MTLYMSDGFEIVCPKLHHIRISQSHQIHFFSQITQTDFGVLEFAEHFVLFYSENQAILIMYLISVETGKHHMSLGRRMWEPVSSQNKHTENCVKSDF